MKYTVKKLEKKSPEWYVADLSDANGTTLQSVSINKVNKKGEQFPGFDQIEKGAEVNGEHWVSGAGKNYLFEPKPEGQKSGGRPNFDRIIEKKADLINQAQDTKAENIAKAQDRTSWMWAKYQACELYNHDRIGSKLDNEDQTLQKIHDFATKIYLLEPGAPF